MTKPILYILVRSDTISMNPGKKMAQVSHAPLQMISECSKNKTFKKLFKKWKSETENGFGTTIVLRNEENIHHVKDFILFDNTFANVVNDPTYPIQDGNITHTVSFDTCAYVFTSNDEVINNLSKMRLEP